MKKKSLNPNSVICIVMLLIFMVTIHLIYGSCQTTKYHYILQKYYLPNFLPDWMLFENKQRTSNGFMIYSHYNGRWKTWYKNGILEYEGDYLNGIENGVHLSWYIDGNLKSICNYVDGKENGVHTFFNENGTVYVKVVFDMGELVIESN